MRSTTFRKNKTSRKKRGGLGDSETDAMENGTITEYIKNKEKKRIDDLRRRAILDEEAVSIIDMEEGLNPKTAAQERYAEESMSRMEEGYRKGGRKRATKRKGSRRRKSRRYRR